MRTLPAAISTMLALCACQPEAEPYQPEVPETQTPQETPQAVSGVAPVETLAGEWRVAGIDGEPLDTPRGLALSISGSQIVFAAHCGGWIWDYTLDGRQLTTSEVQSPDPNCQTRAPVHPSVFALARAVTSATSAARTPSNGVLIEGGGYSLTLYSQ